jgi:hypothetical protein
MKTTVKFCAAFAAFFLLVFAGGCGDSSDGEETGHAESAPEPPQTELSLPMDAVPFDDAIKAAGYEVVYYNQFPASATGRKGRMLLYGSATGGKDGGAVFVEQWSTYTQWIWHWYFEDAMPATFQRGDFNQDGLWDIRIMTDKGKQIDLIHDEAYALLGEGRHDRIALNGSCSTPVQGHPMWHCLDNNLRTSWQSEIGEGSPAFIEVASPLGLSAGILAINAAEENQPRECQVYADGKKIQSFDLPATTDRQLIQLDSEFRTAKKIRLEILSCHGDGAVVAVAELHIR